MVYKDLTFLLFAKDMSASRGFEKVAASGDLMAKGVAGSMMTAGVAVAGLAIAIGAKTVEMAGNFQAATTRLVTDAGESSKTMGKLSSGLLDISVQTGTAADEIAQGMYKVSSSGFTMAHGGLEVMRAAAEGAKVGGADLATVADALTTVMKDYGIGAGQANNTTSELIATVSRGKTTMEDLAGSLHSVLPNAQALGISLNDVLGALATMTQEGISADQATQNLNHTIVALANPTHVQTQEMAAMGLNATTVAAQLGKRGLTGTLNEMVDAITKHMGPQGLVLQKSFTNSALAAQSANTMFKALPTSVKTVAAAYMAGSITQKTWTTAVKAMTPAQANLAKQWAATENASKGFSQQLKSGSGAAQTFTAALAKMTGGQTGLQVALHITGIHSQDTAEAVKAIGAAARGTQKDVSDWDKVQKTHNQTMAEWDAWVNKTGIDIGTALLPAVDKFTANLIDGAHQWGDIFKWLGDTTTQRIDVIEGAFAGAGTWLTQAGKDVIEGLNIGLKIAVPDLSATLNWISSLIPSSVKKFLNINSPSKVMIPIGHSVGEGLQVGLLGSADAVKSTASKLASVITGQFKAGDISKGAEDAALSTVTRMSARLQALSKQRDAVNSSLSNLRTDRSNLTANVRTSSLGQGDITGFAATGDAVEGLQGMIRNTRQFKVDLWKLRHMGVGQTMFAQLVQGWQNDPANALRTANELIANPIDLKEIVGLQRQLGAASADLGNYAGAGEYGAAINTRAGQSRVLTWEMQRAAASGLNRAAAETHIHLHLSGTYAGTRDDLAKTVYAAFKDAVKRGAIPKNAYVNP